MDFKLHAPFEPTGDQPRAIEALKKGYEIGVKNQVLLGVTGSGKTFTMANIITQIQQPVLVISHNKTLAAQLYQEFREFFPDNAVSYFVSYYDYYQPEAYIPQTDTYIEKETNINEDIDKLRLSATTNLLTRKDTIIIASVSCIYNLGSPLEYRKFILELECGMSISRGAITKRLIDLQYDRSDYGFGRATFRMRGEFIDIYLAYEDSALRIQIDEEVIKSIKKIDPISGDILQKIDKIVIYPAKHYITDPSRNKEIFQDIRHDLKQQVSKLEKENKLLEAHRLTKKVNYDLEMIEEMGYVNGIENYSRYFDGRKKGQPPYTLLDFFRQPYGDNWLLFIDESHMTIPQIRGMYNGDKSRKQTLIDFGFRLPSALDNRPLKFDEFFSKIGKTVYISATPSIWEISLAKNEAQKHNEISFNGIAQQLIRPTGITDPKITIRPTQHQVISLIKEVIKRKRKKERVLVTTLTKKTAEDLSMYLEERRYKHLADFKHLKDQNFPQVQYLHSDIQTLKRSDILDDLREGKYDCLIGINLLREGLDLPEVSLVAILDADREGFLRSETSLIQTMGRAARHIEGEVIMYADKISGSMKGAIDEINRRRQIQLAYNRKNKITVKNIVKPIREKLVLKEDEESQPVNRFLDTNKQIFYQKLLSVNLNSLTPLDNKKLIRKLEKEMKTAAVNLDFELAATIRDKIKEIER